MPKYNLVNFYILRNRWKNSSKSIKVLNQKYYETKILTFMIQSENQITMQGLLGGNQG